MKYRFNNFCHVNINILTLICSKSDILINSLILLCYRIGLSGKIDISDLTWEQKEKVLRFLFAKMNGERDRRKTAPPSLPPAIYNTVGPDATLNKQAWGLVLVFVFAYFILVYL